MSYKMPEVGQRPAEFQQNMRSVLEYVDNAVESIKIMKSQIEEMGMIKIDGKEYLDKNEVNKLIANFVSKDKVNDMVLEQSKKILNNVNSEISKTKLSINELEKSFIKSSGDICNKVNNISEQISKYKKEESERFDSISFAIDKLENSGFVTTDVMTSKIEPLQLKSEAENKLNAERRSIIENVDVAIKCIEKKIPQMIEESVSDSEKRVSDSVSKSVLKSVLEKITGLMG